MGSHLVRGLAIGLVVAACAACGSTTGPGAAPRDRSAAQVASDFVPLVDEFVAATKTAGWTFEDSRPWSKAAVGSLRGQACTLLAGKHTLQLLLLGPSVKDPKAAAATMRAHLDEGGFAISNEFTPDTPDGEFTVSGQRPDGAVVRYRASQTGQSMDLESECSTQVGLNENVPVGN